MHVGNSCRTHVFAYLAANAFRTDLICNGDLPLHSRYIHKVLANLTINRCQAEIRSSPHAKYLRYPILSPFTNLVTWVYLLLLALVDCTGECLLEEQNIELWICFLLCSLVISEIDRQIRFSLLSLQHLTVFSSAPHYVISFSSAPQWPSGFMRIDMAPPVPPLQYLSYLSCGET